MARIFPKVDGRLDGSDFGPLSHPPFTLGSTPSDENTQEQKKKERNKNDKTT